jgi:hypothetical protein
MKMILFFNHKGTQRYARSNTKVNSDFMLSFVNLSELLCDPLCLN